MACGYENRVPTNSEHTVIHKASVPPEVSLEALHSIFDFPRLRPYTLTNVHRGNRNSCVHTVYGGTLTLIMYPYL